MKKQKQRQRKQPQRRNAQLLDDAKKQIEHEHLAPGFLYYMRDKLKKEEK